MTESHEEAVERIFAEMAAEPRTGPTPEQRADSLERAQRLQRLQAEGRKAMIAKHGRALTDNEREALVRNVKGK